MVFILLELLAGKKVRPLARPAPGGPRACPARTVPGLAIGCRRASPELLVCKHRRPPPPAHTHTHTRMHTP